MHVALIGFGLVSLSSPRPMEMPSTDAIPVDIVPLEDVAQSVQGDETAAHGYATCCTASRFLTRLRASTSGL